MPRKKKVAEAPVEAAVEIVPQLPLHSPLGASSAERWMNCPGSTALARAIGPGEEDSDPEYRRDGIMAHELASECLKDGSDAWEKLPGYPLLDAAGAAAIQVYLDFVRGLAGDPFPGIHIADLKFGEGIVVEPEENPQISYYGFGFLNGEVEANFKIAGINGLQPALVYVEKRVHLPEFHPLFYGTVDFALVRLSQEGIQGDYHDDTPVRLTIVQPRVPWHPRGPIRSWDTTAGEIRKWAYEKLRPAMEVAQMTLDFELGDWCRFCPAKLLCPLMKTVVDEAVIEAVNPVDMTQEQLAHYRGREQAVKMFYKALDERIYRLMSAGQAGDELKGVVKLVNKITYRAWKADAEAAIVAKLGRDKAFSKPELLSPAKLEELGPDAKALVAEFAFIPPANGTTLASIDDPRRAIDVTPIEQRYGVDTAPALW